MSNQVSAHQCESHGELPCPDCGYLRRGVHHRDKCPECGARGFDGDFVFSGIGTMLTGVNRAFARRFVLITVIGAGDSRTTAPAPSRRFLKTVMDLKGQAEDHLRASGLDHTIIRPGGLGDVKATGTAVLADDPRAFSYISRTDLADLAVQALGDPTTIGKTYNAYDPSRRTMWKMFND